MRTLLICLLLFIAPLFLLGQDSTAASAPINLDSLPEEEHGFFYKPKLVLGLGGHNSLVGGEKVRIGGLRLGLEFREKWRFGISFQSLNPPLFPIDATGQDTIFYKVDFGYGALFVDYILLNNRRWEFSTGVLLGAGSADVGMRLDENEPFVPTRKAEISLIEISGVGYYKVWKWLGIGAALGYRSVGSDDPNAPELSRIVRKAFDGPNWAIKTKIYVGELWRAVFKKKDKKKKKKKEEKETIDRGTKDSE